MISCTKHFLERNPGAWVPEAEVHCLLKIISETLTVPSPWRISSVEEVQTYSIGVINNVDISCRIFSIFTCHLAQGSGRRIFRVKQERNKAS